MSDRSIEPTLIAITVALEALELRLAEAGAYVNEALNDVARGRLNGAVGAIMPLAMTMPEASALVSSIMVLHRHGLCDGELSSNLFTE